MSSIHKNLANGRWQTFSFMLQMGNIGSEVSRVTMLREINKERSAEATLRALELLDLTIQDPKNAGRLKELCQLREVLALNDTNQSTGEQWANYFYPFAYASAIERNA